MGNLDLMIGARAPRGNLRNPPQHLSGSAKGRSLRISYLQRNSSLQLSAFAASAGVARRDFGTDGCAAGASCIGSFERRFPS